MEQTTAGGKEGGREIGRGGGRKEGREQEREKERGKRGERGEREKMMTKYSPLRLSAPIDTIDPPAMAGERPALSQQGRVRASMMGGHGCGEEGATSMGGRCVHRWAGRTA